MHENKKAGMSLLSPWWYHFAPVHETLLAIQIDLSFKTVIFFIFFIRQKYVYLNLPEI